MTFLILYGRTRYWNNLNLQVNMQKNIFGTKDKYKKNTMVEEKL